MGGFRLYLLEYWQNHILCPVINKEEFVDKAVLKFHFFHLTLIERRECWMLKQRFVELRFKMFLSILIQRNENIQGRQKMLITSFPAKNKLTYFFLRRFYSIISML